ncbi:MAG TPA: hypothetical protein VGM90_17980 [Kofleriaceae bacterium]|jgi:hypothetical protein
MAALSPLQTADRIATIAAGLGIQTALIGAYALAAHRYVRGTKDIDLATDVSLADLVRLQRAIEDDGFKTTLRTPDDEDSLGGVLVAWRETDADGDPVSPLEVVNFANPYRPRLTPATRAIRNAEPLDERPALRYPQLEDLVALKLYSGGRRDAADVVELLVHNPRADFEEIRRVAKTYGFDVIDTLIREAQELIARSGG